MPMDDSTITRPRLLFLGHTLPFPPDWGAALRSYHTLRALAGPFDVDGLFFHGDRDATQMPLDDRVRHLEKLAHIELFRASAEPGDLRRWLLRLPAQLTGRSPAEWRYADHRYRRRVLERVFERDPRLVHVDSLRLHMHLPFLGDRATVLVHDGAELAAVGSELRTDGQRHEGDTLPVPGWVEDVEQEWLPRLSATLVPFESHREALLERVPGARVETVAPAIDLEHFSPATGSGHGLAYVGGTATPASRDALDFFTEEILPRLRSASGVQALEPISWIGPAREGDRERYRSRGIDVTGYVEDIRPIVRPAACFIVPRRIEGGHMRILQAWAMGKAVVSTAVGCAGLHASEGENILIRNDPAGFAEAVLQVLEDGDLRRCLGDGGRATVEERYGWDRRGAELVALYRELSKRP